MKDVARVIVVVAAVLLAGCAESVRATDGNVLSSIQAAVRASAAHDLGCGSELIQVEDVSSEKDYNFVASGCGWRATYHCRSLNTFFQGYRGEIVQTGRFPLGRPGASPAGPTQ